MPLQSAQSICLFSNTLILSLKGLSLKDTSIATNCNSANILVLKITHCTSCFTTPFPEKYIEKNFCRKRFGVYDGCEYFYECK